MVLRTKQKSYLGEELTKSKNDYISLYYIDWTLRAL